MCFFMARMYSLTHTSIDDYLELYVKPNIVYICRSASNARVYLLDIGSCMTRRHGPISFMTRIADVSSRSMEAVLVAAS
jgi:hypothetical protein